MLIINELFSVVSVFVDNTPMAMVSSYLGLFGAMGAMAVGQAFTSELFPTSVRIKVWFFNVSVKHISILIVEIKLSTEKNPFTATAVIYTGAMGGSFVVPFWMIIDDKAGSNFL